MTWDFFGKFGGCYMPESLMPALQELERAANTFFVHRNEKC